MNKKADSNLLMRNVTYLILLAIFVVLIFLSIRQKANTAAIWEDYYVKEITKVIDLSKPGDNVTLNVQKATEIAFKNTVGQSEIFRFDNLKNEICIKLSQGRATCFSYFNEVDITEPNIELGVPENVLHFSVKEKAK